MLESKDTRLGGGVVWVIGNLNQEVHPCQGEKAKRRWAWPRRFGGKSGIGMRCF